MASTLKMTAAAAAVLLTLSAPALARSPPAAAPTPPPSRWARTPAPGQYRQMRASAGVKPGSRAVVRCHVDDAGALSACATVTETPAGSGYGRALASLAPAFQIKPELVKAEAPGGLVFLFDSTFQYDNSAGWLRKPTEEDLGVVWPRAAWSRGLGGRATINCMVSLQGALFECVVVSEDPPGQNFGAAAVALTPQFLMKPATLKGQPAVSVVSVPILFKTDGPGGGDLSSDGGRKMVQAAMAWPEAPSYAEVAAAYPRKARAAGLGGRATLDCEFMASGRLWRCNTINEEPKGQGFAEAAKALAKHFRAFATTSDGKPLSGAAVQLPFAFDPAMLSQAIPTIGKSQWAGLPSAADTQAAFAAVTKAGGGTVRVMLACTVQPGGGVSGCAVEREEPAGQGVGLAALTLAQRFRVTTWTTEGLPTVGGTINIPLRYEGAGKEPAPAAKP